MTTGYKLTDATDQTHGGCQWGENVTHETNGEGDLCGSGWLHCYSDPYLAVLLNPIHADFREYHLWVCEGGGTLKNDNGLKLGYTRLTTIKRIDPPKVTPEHRVRFGILSAQHVYADADWNRWADSWLSGADRSAKAARAAEARAAEAAWAAVRAADAAPIDLIALAREACEVTEGGAE